MIICSDCLLRLFSLRDDAIVYRYANSASRDWEYSTPCQDQTDIGAQLFEAMEGGVLRLAIPSSPIYKSTVAPHHTPTKYDVCCLSRTRSTKP